jgi:hypothetical protein
MPDSGDIDGAVLAVLNADTALLGYMPDGVWFDVAPPGAKRFVVVTLFDPADVDTFGGRDVEAPLYAVQAVGLSSLSPNMKAAAARIDALFSDPPAIVVNGFTFSACYRDEPGRIRHTVVDEVDASLRWYHRGGHYRVECARG